jgi:hypothetical protein
VIAIDCPVKNQARFCASVASRFLMQNLIISYIARRIACLGGFQN